MAWLQPEWVVGVGTFAARQAERALSSMNIKVGCMTHPSPANPRANQGWAALIERELCALGIGFP
jgi:single-strand selective monofunctional uracil DNA glycosylase